MTSTTDEIAALRAALKAIRTWVGHRIKDGATQGDTVELIAAQLDRALKTPRASKVVEPEVARLRGLLSECDVVLTMIPAKSRDDGWMGLLQTEYVAPLLRKMRNPPS